MAELLWISHAQRNLKQQKILNKLRRQLNLFLDDRSLWRCGGQLQNAELPYSTKHPILLPHGHKISTLVVREAHRRVFYNEVKETLTEVHRKYWKVNGRSFTKAIVHGCTVCKVPHLQGGCKVFNTGSKAPFQNNWPSRVFNV